MEKIKAIYKNGERNIKFHDNEIEEYEFYQYKRPISINHININKAVVSNMLPFSKWDYKCFIGNK